MRKGGPLISGRAIGIFATAFAPPFPHLPNLAGEHLLNDLKNLALSKAIESHYFLPADLTLTP